MTKIQKQEEKKVTSKQVRLEERWHRELKYMSADTGVTITRLLSRVCEEYFGSPKTNK